MLKSNICSILGIDVIPNNRFELATHFRKDLVKNRYPLTCEDDWECLKEAYNMQSAKRGTNVCIEVVLPKKVSSLCILFMFHIN